ncbi:MAG: polysaccharide deacetylase family protein [Treponema sp.]
MNKRYAAWAFALVCLVSGAAASIKFGEADINAADKIAFTVGHSFAGTYGYGTAFTADLKNGVPARQPEAITYFPERLELLADALQIRNRYGIARYDFKSGSAQWKKTFNKLPVNSMRTLPFSSSPDGKWQCIIEKTRYASGSLILEQTANGKRAVLDTESALNYERLPVKWCPDSSVFVYEKGGALYFCKPEAFIKGIEAEEKYRKICTGRINAAHWADSANLVYIDGDIVYKLGAKEFYTRALYSEIIGGGTALGRLPDRFDSARDIFSVNRALSSLVVIKSAKFFSYYRLKSAASSYLEILQAGAYIDSDASVLDAEVIWGNAADPFIWFRLMPYTGKKIMSAVYRLSGGLARILEIENSNSPVLSPDGAKCAFFSGGAVYVYDTSKWTRLADLDGDNAVCLLWKNNDELIAGGERTVRLWNTVSGGVQTLFASSAQSVFWSEDGAVVVADIGGGQTLGYDVQGCRWTSDAFPANESRILNSNRNYRAFSGRTPNSDYENALYVRTLTGKAATKALFPESAEKSEGKKKAALFFDAYNAADGLPRILYELSLYNIAGTFFLNGEFIRRYPNETRQIAGSGNECASMFFSLADFSKGGFVPDEAFIRRGLARNEDEFAQCTRKELSLLWHAPYYAQTDGAASFAQKAGYETARVASPARDFIPLEDAAAGERYYTAEEIIDAYMNDLERAGGGAVSVSVGLPRGSRESYLYERLDLLISALLDAGFEINRGREKSRTGKLEF